MDSRGIIELSASPGACAIREAARGVPRCKYITPEPIDIQAVWRSTVKSPTTGIVKPILLIVTAIVALWSIVARADAIDTEHLFGFTIGTDVGEVGEKEFESNTLSRLGKRAGSYSALSQSLSLEYTAVQNLRLEVSATGVYYDIVGVPGLDDRRQGAFDGLSFDMRYRILDRAHAPFGLMIDAEPHWGRVDEVSGEPVDRYGVDLALVADKELVPNRIVAAFNLLYLPEIAHSRVTGIWSRQATIGVATALMAQIAPDVFAGIEARYLRSYEGLGLDGFAGHAFFVGPTIYAKLSERSWILFAWNVQAAGRSADDPAALDLRNFERHQATLKFGLTF
jgi:hypothetical protein